MDHKQTTDDLRAAVERAADNVLHTFEPLVEIGWQRKFTMREGDRGDESLHALRQALDNLEKHRLTRAD